MAVVMHDNGRRLVVQGTLQVYHNGGWVNCYVAMWDGSAWRPVAWIGELDVCEFRMTSDTWGYAGDEQDRSLVVVCGRIAEFADDPNRIGSNASTPGYGMVAIA